MCIVSHFLSETKYITVHLNTSFGKNLISVPGWAVHPLRWIPSEVWLTWWERCFLQMWCLQLSVQLGPLDGLGSKLCAVIEAGSPWGSALIANKVYLLPTTATTAQQSVFDPRLPSLCGLIMKVRIAIYTQSHSVFPKPPQPCTVIQYRQDNYSKESCMKQLSVLRHRRAICACITAHRRTSTQKVRLTIPLTVFLWPPPGIFFHSFNFTAKERRQLCLLGTKHIGKWTRFVLNKTSSEESLMPTVLNWM